MSKTILFQTIHFSISAQFSSIWTIDKTLSGATTLGQSGPESEGNKGYSTFPKALALLEPQHKIISVISRTLIGWGSYSSAEMQSVYFTAPADWATLVEGLLLFCRDAVGVFYSPPTHESWLGHARCGGGSYPSAEMMQSVYSTTSADWAPLDGWGSYPSAETQPVYSTATPPANWASLKLVDINRMI